MALVLIVDDEHSVRQVLARWIQRAGHEIREAESADAALEVMEKQPAAVMFATQVSTVAPHISIQAGVLAYLVKPFRQESVIHALDAALAWHTGTVATGSRPEDTPERLQAWLDSLE